jgi:ABC-type transport system substrate-binding protein
MVPLGIVLVVAVMAAGCSRSEDTAGPGDTSQIGSADTSPDVVKPASTQTPKNGGTLVYGLEAETDGWNPTVNRWANSGTQIALAIYDPLVVLDKDLNWKPYLAESITSNTDFTQWTVKLRANIKFHDGEDLTADALVKSFNAFKASPLTGAAAAPVQSATKVDNLSVLFTMTQPWATWPFGLTGQAGVVPAPKQLDADPATASNDPIGTGPFVFKSWQRDDKLVATKNPNYWRPGLPYLDEIDFKPIPDDTSRYNSLKSGDINLMVTSAEPTIGKLLPDGKAGSIQVTRSVGNNDVTLVLLNVQKPPLDNLKVRQAMAYALDKRALDDISSTDPSLEANTVYQPESKWYTPAPDYPSFDLDKAKSLVQSVGSPVSFTMTSTTDPDTLRVAQAEAQMWQAAGMQVQVNTIDQATLIGNAVSGNYQAQVWRQFGAADPDLNYVWWIGANAAGPLALNMARNVDQQTDDALNAGRATTDFNTRKAAYAKVQQRQTDLLPYLWLSHLRWTLGASNNVRGLQGMPLPDNQGMSSGLVGGVIPVTAMWIDS